MFWFFYLWAQMIKKVVDIFLILNYFAYFAWVQYLTLFEQYCAVCEFKYALFGSYQHNCVNFELWLFSYDIFDDFQFLREGQRVERFVNNKHFWLWN